jgi:hypothetical protein
MTKKRVIVLRNETRRKDLIAKYKKEGWWVSDSKDRAAKGDEVVFIRVLEIYIDGLDEFNELYGLEADFSDVFGQLEDLKKVLDVTKQYVERPILNEYPEDEESLIEESGCEV